MKTKALLLLPLLLALPAFGGTSAKEVIAPAPPPNPCQFSWFTGGSVGWLTELEEPMYNVHVGVTDSCWVLAGCKVSLFLEVGYTEKDEDYNGHGYDYDYEGEYDNEFSPGNLDGETLTTDELGNGLQNIADYTGDDTSYDLQIVPVTFNVKFERNLTGNLNAYLGAGLGVAWVNLDIDAGRYGDMSDSDWVFYSQVFGGLSYNFTPGFQVYGGARWTYTQDADFGDGGSGISLDLGSDCLLELGARYQF